MKTWLIVPGGLYSHSSLCRLVGMNVSFKNRYLKYRPKNFYPTFWSFRLDIQSGFSYIQLTLKGISYLLEDTVKKYASRVGFIYGIGV